MATGELSLPVSERDHIRDPKNAPVILVKYGDYECPYCGRAHFIVKELQQLTGDLMRFVYRHFPLTSVHPHAEQAAEAAEAAGAQGKFWEMHNHLFEHQQALDRKHLIEYAANLGLDVPRFSHELVEHAHVAKIREDLLSGIQSGVNGTPTFFINGVRHDGSYDLRSLLAAIENAAES
ncbi:DsbA family protein [Nostoc sp. FACHB-145]|nr:DsbA family protein [Nostoc sp. FACHB-145]